MAKTFLDEVVNYPYQTVNKISQSQNIVALLLNDVNVDISSEKTELALESCLFDYDYVEDIIQESKSFICVDTVIPQFSSATIKEVYLTVLVCVHKDVMKIPSSFKIKGNRRDNLVREIDYALRGSFDYGIGKLNLKSVKSVLVNKDFSCKTLIYEVPNFANGGVK